LETKRIADYAEEHGVAMAIHHAGIPWFEPGYTKEFFNTPYSYQATFVVLYQK
jgi:hypothetical protein